jgi:PilZ domain
MHHHATQSGERAERVRPDPERPIDVHLMSDNFLDIFEARDISVTGVGIYVPYRFEGCRLTSPVELVITLPGSEPFLARGRLVHRTKKDREFFGVEFLDMPPDYQSQIARYVESRLAEHAHGEPRCTLVPD